MEWLNSDAPGDESPPCVCCGKQIGIGVDAIALRVGTVQCSGRLYTFQQSRFEDLESVRWFHFSCIEVLLDFAAADQAESMCDCAFCPEDLLGESECYELESGIFEIRKSDTWWSESHDLEGQYIRAYSCKECLEMGLGEGNEAQMRQRLGKPLQPEHTKKWIYPQEIPRSMQKDPPTPLRYSGLQPFRARR